MSYPNVDSNTITLFVTDRITLKLNTNEQEQEKTMVLLVVRGSGFVTDSTAVSPTLSPAKMVSCKYLYVLDET